MRAKQVVKLGFCWLWALYCAPAVAASGDRTGSWEPILQPWHTADVRFVDASADGRYAASLSGDGTLRTWDLGPSTSSTTPVVAMGVRTVAAERTKFPCFALAPDGRRLAWATPTGIQILETATLKPIETIDDQPLTCPRRYLDDATLVAVRGKHPRLYARNPTSGEWTGAGSIELPEGTRAWALSSDRKWILVGTGEDCGQHHLAPLPAPLPDGHRPALEPLAYGADELAGRICFGTSGPLAFSADNKRALAAGFNNVAVWNLGDAAATHRLKHAWTEGNPDTGGIDAARFGRDANHLSVVMAGVHFGWDLAAPTTPVKAELPGALNSKARGTLRLVSGRAGHGDVVWGGSFGQVGRETFRGGQHVPARSRKTFRLGRLIEGLDFSPDSKTLAVAHGGQLSLFASPVLSKPTLSVEPKAGAVVDVAFRPDGKQLAVVTQKRGVLLLDPVTGKVVHSLDWPDGRATRVEWHPDGARLAVGGTGGTLMLWSPGSDAKTPVAGATDTLRGLAFGPDGKRLSAVGEDGIVRVWNLEPLGLRWSREPPQGKAPLTSVAYSPSGDQITVGSAFLGKNPLTEYDAATGEALSQWDADSFGSAQVHYLDSGRIVSGSLNGRATVWRGAEHTEEAVLPTGGGYATELAASANGCYLAVGTSGNGNAVLLWRNTTPPCK